MKIKTDFVTNSSSASFTIHKSKLNELQIILILNHMKADYIFNGNQYQEYVDDHDEWTITETDDIIEGRTTMDNFDMFEFLIKIGVNEEDIDYWRS
jgi:hypothetical protein